MDDIEVELLLNIYYGYEYKTINPTFVINKTDEKNVFEVLILGNQKVHNTNLFKFSLIDENIYKVKINYKYKNFDFYINEIKNLGLTEEEELFVVAKYFKNAIIQDYIPDEIKNKINNILEKQIVIIRD